MEPAQNPDENAEIIRESVPMADSQEVIEDSDRSPTKTERDVAARVEAPGEDSVVRKLVVPVPLSEDEDGDRSPTKTERG